MKLEDRLDWWVVCVWGRWAAVCIAVDVPGELPDELDRPDVHVAYGPVSYEDAIEYCWDMVDSWEESDR